MNTNYFSMTTPQGLGGIGVIELFGRDALEIIGKIFKPAKHKGRIKPNKIYLGHIIDNPPRLPRGPAVAGPLAMTGPVIDEVIIHFIPARNSLTKLDTVEINAHGGIMPCRLIGSLLKKFGVKELLQAAVINLAHKQGEIDYIQKEALGYLIQAQTPLAASVLLDQYNGALSKALKSGRNLNELRSSARFGLALTHPKRILILGRPNVGKSTLFNALLGQDRAITHHLPGTTRDTIEDILAIDGFPFILVDTAGLRKSTKNTIEKIGMAYARKEIPKADVILLVVEKRQLESLTTLVNQIRGKTQAPMIVVMNKTDLPHKLQPLNSNIQSQTINISALKQTGIDRLRKEILKACGLDRFSYKPGQPVVFTKKQLALIH